jgi:hypothetical protein
VDKSRRSEGSDYKDKFIFFSMSHRGIQIISKRTKGDKALSLYMKTAPERDHTLEEISNIMGVTRERVRQIEAKALRKLRFQFKSILKKDDLSDDDLIRLMNHSRANEYSLTR